MTGRSRHISFITKSREPWEISTQLVGFHVGFAPGAFISLSFALHSDAQDTLTAATL